MRRGGEEIWLSLTEAVMRDPAGAVAGDTTSADTRAPATALATLAIGLLFFAGVRVVVPAFFALVPEPLFLLADAAIVGLHAAAEDLVADLAEILRATQRLQPPLRAATYRTLLGLLAATGMRLGEATALTRADAGLAEGMVTLRHAKFDRIRLVPLHPSVTAALRAYAATRDRLCPTPRVDRFFVSVTGRALRRGEADQVFRMITGLTGIRTDTVHPRIHGLRHSFAVHTLIDWHRQGADISALLPVLSTYLGHVAPSDTYWYLQAVPEVLEHAARDLDVGGGLRVRRGIDRVGDPSRSLGRERRGRHRRRRARPRPPRV